MTSDEGEQEVAHLAPAHLLPARMPIAGTPTACPHIHHRHTYCLPARPSSSHLLPACTHMTGTPCTYTHPTACRRKPCTPDLCTPRLVHSPSPSTTLTNQHVEPGMANDTGKLEAAYPAPAHPKHVPYIWHSQTRADPTHVFPRHNQTLAHPVCMPCTPSTCTFMRLHQFPHTRRSASRGRTV